MIVILGDINIDITAPLSECQPPLYSLGRTWAHGGPPGSPAGRRFRCRLSAGSLIGRRRFECRHGFNLLWRSGGYPQSGLALDDRHPG